MLNIGQQKDMFVFLPKILLNKVIRQAWTHGYCRYCLIMCNNTKCEDLQGERSKPRVKQNNYNQEFWNTRNSCSSLSWILSKKKKCNRFITKSFSKTSLSRDLNEKKSKKQNVQQSLRK